METIISKEELNKMMPFSYDDDILYFPVRHHSPACSVQILKVIKEYSPDCIAIEGPINANDILEFLTSDETKFPIALYYTYKDSGNLLKSADAEENQSTYSCYYPLLEYSPELVAIKEGFKNNIAIKFIDLPFAKRLLNTKKDYGLRKRMGKNNYSDDYLLSSTNIAQALCEKTGASSFDSFWETHFEINGLNLTPQKFVNQFNAYTYLLRKAYNEDELLADSTLIREQFMSEQIMEIKKQYKKVLVITGGFHTYGLMHPQPQEKLEYNKISKQDEDIYLMPYSMEETDALNGYASGMISPGFYQNVWENISLHKNKPYDDTVLSLILKTAKEAKKKKILITMSDEASAYNIASGLARLRGKAQCGKYECMDGILSSFIKGELNSVTELPIDIINNFFTGNSIGNIPKNSPTPPIVKDFLEKTKNYRLKVDNSIKKEITLNIFKQQNHRQISRFFHTLNFLSCDFCNQLRGSNLKSDKDRNIIREIWEYRISPMVITRLIEHSIHGASVANAAYHLLGVKISEANSATKCALLLIDSFLMGTEDKLELLKLKTMDVITSDDDYFSLGQCLYNLIRLYRLREFYGENNNLDYIKLIESCFQKTLNTLSFIKNSGEDTEQDAIKIIKLLYDISSKTEFLHLKKDLKETFCDIIQSNNINPTILGAINGILYAVEHLSSASIIANFNNYLADTSKAIDGARFLSGVFFTARDIVFASKELLKAINSLISILSGEDFINILPDLKLTFSYFTPSEIDKISKSITNILSLEDNLLYEKGISEQSLLYGTTLNNYLLEKLEEETNE